MFHRRVMSPACGLVFVLLAHVAVPEALAGLASQRSRAPGATLGGLASLPAEAKASISGALGRDQRDYHAKRVGEGWRLDNPKHGLQAAFTARGVEVRKGAARFGLQLTGVGRGARLEALSAGTPEAKANRIEYRRGSLTEWYVNGPLGLEQGFTLHRPPAQASGEALTLALQLLGGLTAVPDAHGDGVTMKTPEGFAVLRYRGLVAWDAKGSMLSAWWQVADSTVRLRVDDTGARYPLTIDPIFEDAKLTASDGAGGDRFGEAVAIDGDTVVVGAFADDVGSNSAQGSAYVFVRPVRGWSGLRQESAKLTGSDSAAGDIFGNSVAVDGSTVVVGARFDDVGNNSGQGSIYVFVRPAGGWAGLLQESAKLVASDGAAGDSLGDSIAISRDTVVARAPGDDIGANPDQGSAYVFVKPAGGWTGLLQESAKLVASDGAPNDLFFFTTLDPSVAVSVDTVVVGARGDDLGTNPDQGSAYVFVKPAGGWAGSLPESAKLTASDGEAGDNFGFNVAASRDTVVVGTLVGGRPAYVFVEPLGGWAGALHENARLTSSDGVSGFSVAASGNTVVVAPNVYFKPGSGWAGVLTEDGRLTRSDGSPAFFGAVGVDGNTAVGGFCDNTTQGSACVFEGLAGAEPATTRIRCNIRGCKVSITCNLSQNCTIRIRLLVRALDVRLRKETRAKTARLVRFASAVTSIPPGETRPFRLKLTQLGRDVVTEKKKRRLRGVIEIRNAAATPISNTPVSIRLR